MARRRMKKYRVPVVIAEDRTLTVLANSPEHAAYRATHGEYQSAGKPGQRGILYAKKHLIVEVPRDA